MILSSEEKRIKRNAYMRAWNARNKDKKSALDKSYRLKNKEKYAEKQKKKYERWKKEKPEELKAMQKRAGKKYAEKKPWRRPENVEKMKVRVREWAKKNPERIKIIRKRAKAKRRNVVGSYTYAEWELLLKQYGYTCPSCLKTGIELHADHIIPIIKGGSNFIENIQPLCKPCNSRKYTTTIKYPIPG